MNDRVVRELARAAAGGDYTACVPLLDRLKELGDDRWQQLFQVMGHAAHGLRSVPPTACGPCRP